MSSDHPNTNPFYVYVLFREDGHPFYIGKGQHDRWFIHERRARAGERSHRAAIIRSMQARGIEVPKVKLHQGLTEKVAHAYEIALIAAIGRYPNGPLVNLTAGGEGGSDPSPKTREKLAAAIRGRKWSPEAIAKRTAKRLGRTHTSETRAKMATAHRGKTIPPKVREKLAVALRGKKRLPETVAKVAAANRGKTHTPEVRAKMRKARLRWLAAKKASISHDLGQEAFDF